MQRLQKLEIWLDDNLAGVRRRKKAEAAYYCAHVSKWGLVCLRWCGFYPPVGACAPDLVAGSSLGTGSSSGTGSTLHQKQHHQQQQQQQYQL